MGEDSVSGVTGTVSESALLKSDNMFTQGPPQKRIFEKFYRGPCTDAY